MKRPLKWAALVACGLVLIVGGMLVHSQYSHYQEVRQERLERQELFSPVVRLTSEFVIPGSDGSQDQVRKIRGSGVVVYSQPNELGTGYVTYVLTCNHVVETPILKREGQWAKKVGVEHRVTYVEYFDTLTGMSIKAPARVVAQSPNNVFKIDEDGNMELVFDSENGGGEDLALLRLETEMPFKAVKLLPPEKVKQLKVLDDVRLVGCALGDKPAPTLGEVARLTDGFMQVTAPIIFGNSGGACFLADTREFIGISNAMRIGGGFPVTHMGLVRPVERVYSWLEGENYSFIYDRTVPEAVRHELIRMEEIKHKLQLKEEYRKLQQRLGNLNNLIVEKDKELEALKQKVAELEQLKQQITEMQNRDLYCEVEEILRRLQEEVERP